MIRRYMSRRMQSQANTWTTLNIPSSGHFNSARCLAIILGSYSNDEIKKAHSLFSCDKSPIFLIILQILFSRANLLFCFFLLSLRKRSFFNCKSPNFCPYTPKCLFFLSEQQVLSFIVQLIWYPSSQIVIVFLYSTS